MTNKELLMLRRRLENIKSHYPENQPLCNALDYNINSITIKQNKTSPFKLTDKQKRAFRHHLNDMEAGNDDKLFEILLLIVFDDANKKIFGKKLINYLNDNIDNIAQVLKYDVPNYREGDKQWHYKNLKKN